MKILHVIPSYEPAWAFGGTVTATSNLCRGLARQEVDVTVYTTDADGKGGHLNVPLNEPVVLGGVKTWYFHCDFGVKKAFYSRGLAKKLKETVKDFNLVHVSSIWQWIGVDVNKACKYFDKPYIVSTHGSFNPWPWNQNIFKKRIFWHLFQKKTIENSTALHFTAEDERIKSLSAVHLLDEKASFVIANGIEIEEYIKSKNIRKDLNIPDDKFVILFIGRVHRKKGLHLIIQSLEKVNSEEIYLIIVGPKEDKSYADYLFNLSKGISSNIIWYGQIQRDKVWDFYVSSDILVLPSYDENFGYTAVEAMVSSLPVLISKNVGIWREVQLDNTGFVVNQDVDEIAQIIEKCLENPEILKEFSQNARKSAEKRYDINKVADLMIKAYEDVLTGRRSPELQWK